MATFEQIKEMFEMQEEKTNKRLDKLEKHIKKNVKEALTEEVIKNVVDSLTPTIIKEVEKEVLKVIEPVKRQFDKTESDVSKLKEVVENLTSKITKNDDERARIDREFPALQITEQGTGAGRGSGAGRGAGGGEGAGGRLGDGGGARRHEPAMSEKEKEVRRMFHEANSTLTFSPIYKNNWETQVKTSVEEGVEVSSRPSTSWWRSTWNRRYGSRKVTWRR